MFWKPAAVPKSMILGTWLTEHVSSGPTESEIIKPILNILVHFLCFVIRIYQVIDAKLIGGAPAQFPLFRDKNSIRKRYKIVWESPVQFSLFCDKYL